MPAQRLGVSGNWAPMTSNETVAQYLATRLPDFGVTHVFELVGGMITVLLDAMHQNPALSVVSTHHEQGAGFAAEGFARAAGRPAVAMATSGPGATNLLTAIGSCHFDSVPVVFITGQVNRSEQRRDDRGRQGGFQETDIVAMATPVTKWATMVVDPEDFPRVLREAFRIATAGRPGPVLIDIPMDVQRSFITGDDSGVEGSVHAAKRAEPVDPEVGRERTAFLARLRAALSNAERPLLLAGGGIRSAGVVAEFRAALDVWGVPVVTTLLGLDSVAADCSERIGFLGSYGNRWANWAVAEADLLIVLGSRLDVRQTGSDVAGFHGDRQIFQVDVDGTELNNHVTGCEVLHDDLALFLPVAVDALRAAAEVKLDWRAALEAKRELWPDTNENVPAAGINPNQAVREIGAAWGDVSAFVTDVGQHQMWAAQSLQLGPNQRFLTSGGMGSMGFGLPAAIGAALNDRPAPVCLIAGDGGFQCNIQELQTLVRQRLPLRMVIFDNGCHGMVRQFQESYFDSRFYSTQWGYSTPDFCALASAYGITAIHVSNHRELARALIDIAEIGDRPTLLHVEIDAGLNVYPKMAFGQPFGSMEPAISPTEMEGT
jgi:acetolactate synthase-1/2/3 large subunit